MARADRAERALQHRESRARNQRIRNLRRTQRERAALAQYELAKVKKVELATQMAALQSGLAQLRIGALTEDEWSHMDRLSSSLQQGIQGIVADELVPSGT